MILIVNLTKREHFVDSDVDGRIIFKYIFKKQDEDMDWSDLAEERDRRFALVNAVMNIRVA